MLMFPRTPAEALASGLTAEVMRAGGVESCRPPRLCLDVLAQHWSRWRPAAAMTWMMCWLCWPGLTRSAT
jgi:hypothetical protein